MTIAIGPHPLYVPSIVYTVLARALGHSFLLFLRHQEPLSEEYDIAVAALGTQQLANRSHT